jgi:hypothetical protein
MNDANQSIRNPANSGAIVDIQNDARTAEDLPPHEVKCFEKQNPPKYYLEIQFYHTKKKLRHVSKNNGLIQYYI